MARARNIKPGFFKNEELAECSAYARLLFIGLWTLADREGRLEYRPKRIKAEIFPYENVEIGLLLMELQESMVLTPYRHGASTYIDIHNFKKHQHPHCKEAGSEIPALSDDGSQPIEIKEENQSTGQAPDKHHASTPLTPIPYTDSPIPKKDTHTTSRNSGKYDYSEDFEEFWSAYPSCGRIKGTKSDAWIEYEKKIKITTHETIMQGVKNYAAYLNATGEFNADARKWLHRQCWTTDYSYATGKSAEASGAGKKTWKSEADRLVDRIYSTTIQQGGSGEPNEGIAEGMRISEGVQQKP